MSGRRRAAGAWVAALVLACGAERDARPAAAIAAPALRIVLVGDSITAGRVSAPPGPPYALLLAESLGAGFEWVNLGCGGTSAPEWTPGAEAVPCGKDWPLPNLYAGRVKPALPADLATLLVGTNDSKQRRARRWTPPEEYEAALREIAEALLADGARRVMLLGPPLVVDDTTAILRIVRYGEAVTRICDELEAVVCGPDLRFVLGVDDFAEGNLHPNGAGHRKIADALAKTLRELYPEAAGGSSEAAAVSSPSGRSHSASAPAMSSSSRLP